MRTLAGLLVVLAVAACGSQSAKEPYAGPRFRSPESHFSTRELPHWRATRDRNATVLIYEGAEGKQSTISVRAVPISGEWVADRTPEIVFPATAKWLASLPEARVSTPSEVNEDGFRGVSFDLSFVPSTGRGARYERRHVVLIGSKYVFHITHTGPAGSLAATSDEFDAVLASFREEV